MQVFEHLEASEQTEAIQEVSQTLATMEHHGEQQGTQIDHHGEQPGSQISFAKHQKDQ